MIRFPKPSLFTANARRAALAVVLLWLLAAGWAWLGQQPPAARAADAAPDTFSAERAEQVLRRVLPDTQPHPVASAANDRVRARIADELRTLRLQPDIRSRFVCSHDTCATVHNVLARIPGRQRDGAVLLTAHYDSVPASPGVSDDGAGVAAVLEAARALLAGPMPPRDVWLLLSDGEEVGLLGAEAFVHEPEFARIASVVNLEARGTAGASRLIETGVPNRRLLQTLGPVLRQPVATSLDNALYQRLPNGTDFTVYLRHGRHGANFAWAQGPSRYHTPLDDLAHLDRRSLQHHGDNLLAAARAFAAQPAMPPAQDSNAVYFRLFGPALLAWPTAWSDLLLLIAVLGWALLPFRQPRASRPAPLAIAVCSGVALLLPVAAWIAAWLLSKLLIATGTLPALWTAQAPWLVAAFLLVPLAVVLFAGRLLSRRCTGSALAIGSLFAFLLLSLLLRLAVPDAIHIGLLPVLAGVVAGHVRSRYPLAIAAVAGAVAAGLITPYALLLYAAMGHPLLPVVSVAGMLMLLPLLPALTTAGRGGRCLSRGAWASTAALALCATVAIVQAPFNATTPHALNLQLVGTASGSQLHADAVAAFPQALVDAGFVRPAAPPMPWSPRMLRPGPAGAALPVPDIHLALLRTDPDGTRHVRMQVRPQRDAASLTVLLPGAVSGESIRVFNTPLAAADTPAQPWRRVRLFGVPEQGLSLRFALPAGAAEQVYAYASSPGLPAAFAPQRAARDRVAVPIHAGDVTLTWSQAAVPRSR